MPQQQEQIDLQTDRQSDAFGTLKPDRLTDEPDQTQMPSETVDALLATLAEERHKRQRLTRRYKSGALGIAVLVLLCTLINWIQTGKFPFEVFNSFSCMAGLIGITAAATRSQKLATQSLAQFQDVRGVGPLAEALTFEDKQVRAVAKEALISLLPRLNASDAHLLDTEQRKCLHRRLWRNNHRFDLDLAIAILKAMEQVGDERDLAAVQRLANHTGRYDKEKRVQAAANACLPFLQRRADENLARQSLLRAADLTTTPADQLVRPAGMSDLQDPQTLLRACMPNGQSLIGSQLELVRAILRDLETTGDARALPYVEQLAATETLPTELQCAVQRCLIRLRTGTEQTMLQSTVVRN